MFRTPAFQHSTMRYARGPGDPCRQPRRARATVKPCADSHCERRPSSGKCGHYILGPTPCLWSRTLPDLAVLSVEACRVSHARNGRCGSRRSLDSSRCSTAAYEMAEGSKAYPATAISCLPDDCGFASRRHLAHERLGRSGGNAKRGRHAAYAPAGSHSKTAVFGANTAPGDSLDLIHN